MKFNAVVGVGLIGVVKRKFFNQLESLDSNSCDVLERVESKPFERIIGVRSNSSDMIGGFSPNSRDIIVYRSKRH
jgi:hypothetical protein